jgi:2-oxoglutarate ferredoxin oxidoreductase subunit alpha
MKGNEALAEAAIRAGCRFFFGYPITPQTEINAYMAKNMPKVNGTYLQAESEIAAANMLLGAASAGVRAMTSSSSPGISLKTEALSFLAGSDLPCLVVNIQRAGPGLGGIQPAQADYFQATKAPGHGDLHLLVFAPAGVQEMADLVFDAYDLSEKYRVPAMILGDGFLGQMMEPIDFSDKTAQPAAKPWATRGHGNKRAKNVINTLYLQAEILEEIILARYKTYDLIEKNEQRCEKYLVDDAEIVIVAYGISARISRNAVDAARQQGIKAGLLRPVTLWPFPKNAINELNRTAKRVLVVELSMGQMIEDVRLALNCGLPVRHFGRAGGMAPAPEDVLGEIVRLQGGNG